MLYTCARDVMDAVLSACTVTRSAVVARAWKAWVSRHADVVYLYFVCILWQFSMKRST